MRKLSALFLLVSFSCVKDLPKVTILNATETVYDSIQVYASEHTKTIFKEVKPQDKRSGIISFGNENTGDGCYKLMVFKDGYLLKNKCFGYYTNGKSLNSRFNIEIAKDTILIDY